MCKIVTDVLFRTMFNSIVTIDLYHGVPKDKLNSDFIFFEYNQKNIYFIAFE